jgi:hypothetical protein
MDDSYWPTASILLCRRTDAIGGFADLNEPALIRRSGCPGGVQELLHSKSDPDLWKAIAAGFDDAASEVENIAIQHGAEAKSELSLEALRIVGINRKASLGAGLLAEVGDKSKFP